MCTIGCYCKNTENKRYHIQKMILCVEALISFNMTYHFQGRDLHVSCLSIYVKHRKSINSNFKRSYTLGIFMFIP